MPSRRHRSTLLVPKIARQNWPWVSSGLGLALLWSWNWPLLLATGAGGGAMLVVYWLPSYPWLQLWQKGERFFSQPTGKLTAAVAGGICVALGTYLAVHLLTEIKNPSLAIALLGQGLLTILIFGLILVQLYVQKKSSRVDEQNWLLALSDPNPLRRLLAVRYLAPHLDKQGQESELSRLVQEYFQLMLTQEAHPQVKAALLESLKLKTLEPLSLEINLPKFNGHYSENMLEER